MRKDKSGLSSTQLRRRRARHLLFTWSLVFLVVIVVISAAGYYYVMNKPSTVDPSPEIIDAVGVKSAPTDGSLSTVKITIRNIGSGDIDLIKVSLRFEGPKAQTVLYMDKTSYSTPTKEAFGVVGLGEPSDGWDPSNGKFLVRGTTLATLVVNLTAAGGINDQLWPHEIIKVTVTIEEGPGSGNLAARSFRVPADLGSGIFIALQSST